MSERKTTLVNSPWPSLLLAAALVVIIVVAVAAAGTWRQQLRVRSVAVEGTVLLTKDDIVRLAAVQAGTRLEDVDLGAVRRRVMTNRFIKAVSVSRDYPATIAIAVEERVPVAAIAADRILYLDGDGMILPPLLSDRVIDVPVLTGITADADALPGTVARGQQIREALELVLLSMRLGPEFAQRISEIHLDPARGLQLMTTDGAVPVYLGDTDFAEKLVRLDGFWEQVLQQRGMEGLEFIDLRYDDQVVVRWHHAQESQKESSWTTS